MLSRWWRAFLKTRAAPKGLVEVSPEGFRHYGKTAVAKVAWDAIVQIDVCREDAFTIDLFSVILHTKAGDTIAIGDYEDELFTQFEEALLGRWPEIEKDWNRVYCGAPFVFEYATLWKAREP